MRINFRQGIVSHQAPTTSSTGFGSFLPGFLQRAGNNYNLIATNKPVTLTIAHKDRNYTFIEDNSVANAWMGPFTAHPHYWLYWDFNMLTFERSFGMTTLEPIAQDVEPGRSDANIVQIIAGVPGIGRIIVDNFYAPQYERTIMLSGTSGNDGEYTITSSTFDGTAGQTTLYVAEEITTNDTSGGIVAFDIDSYGNPLKTVGRHWYDTSTNIHKVWMGNYWSEVLRVFACRVSFDGQAVAPHTIAHGTTLGTQIGDTSSVQTGRVVYDEDANTIRRDNGTFFTTEDQFFSNAARVDAIRLESNVARAQFPIENAVAAFTPVAWYGEGKCRVATYDDIGNTVIGMLTEDVMKNEVGSVVIQGVITNPSWNWSSSNPNYNYIKVGDPLWIENGELVPYDPHALNGVQYKIGRVPVARILSTDTVIFEQGLGGKGDRGPAGSLDNLPYASYEDLGGVYLTADPVIAEEPIAVGDNDPRLDPSFRHAPLAHTHPASEVTVQASGNIEGETVQAVLEELDSEKLSLTGGTMTGMLTLSSTNPFQDNHAASKKYVDGLVSGLLWLDPVCIVNLIAIDIASPPTNPQYSDAYIVPPNPQGAWAIGNPQGINTGDLVVWSGSSWLNRGPLESSKTYRFGIAMTTTTNPSGSLINYKGRILQAPGSDILSFTIETPVNNNAVYVCNESSLHAYQQYAYKADTGKWLQIGGAGTATVVVDNTTIKTTGNVIGTIDYAEGGQVDAATLQGQTLANLDTRYALTSHMHAASDISITPYTTSPNWGTPSDPTTIQLNSTTVESAFREVVDKKASKTPAYASTAQFPVASSVEGMTAYSYADKAAYIAIDGVWEEIVVKISGSIILPYDISLQIEGPIYSQYTQGAVAVTREVNIPAGASGSFAKAIAALSNPLTLDILHNTTIVGSINFAAGIQNGVVNIPNPITLQPGDLLKVDYPSGATVTDNDMLVITIFGTADTPVG